MMLLSIVGSLGTDVCRTFVAVVVNSVIASTSTASVSTVSTVSISTVSTVSISTVSTVSVVSTVSAVSAVVGLLGAFGETNCAACDALVMGSSHSERAADNGVSAGQVNISDEINATLSDGAECAWSLLVVLFLVVEGSTVLANEWVPDSSGRVAAISQVAKSANH